MSNSLKQHLEQLRNIFEKLREGNTIMKLDKFMFCRKGILFLGFTKYTDGIKANDI